jgi:uncharacterized protein (TIGR02058 family)
MMILISVKLLLFCQLFFQLQPFQVLSFHLSNSHTRFPAAHSLNLPLLHMTSTSTTSTGSTSPTWTRQEGDKHVETVLFVECGWGNDSHGQNVTKAAVRACRNAIEFNSIPSVQRLVPDGYQGLKLDVILAVPAKYREGLDLEQVSQVFPYGSIRYQLQDGGMVAPSGIAIERLGDRNEDMVVVCAAVTVGC